MGVDNTCYLSRQCKTIIGMSPKKYYTRRTDDAMLNITEAIRLASIRSKSISKRAVITTR